MIPECYGRHKLLDVCSSRRKKTAKPDDTNVSAAVIFLPTRFSEFTNPEGLVSSDLKPKII
jgi:hypothetical protein